jgi:5'-phosphate synthase pdxT subunit
VKPSPRIGVLALQGCVDLHIEHLRACGAIGSEVKTAQHLNEIDGLILPGGESSTMLKLIEVFQLKEALLAAAQKIPFWGICAGSILMASKVHNPEQSSLNIMDIEVERNAYGRQLQSQTLLLRDYEVALIRAPRIIQHSPKAKIVESQNGEVLMLREETKYPFHQVSTFHAELNQKFPSPFHQEFVEKIKSYSLE